RNMDECLRVGEVKVVGMSSDFVDDNSNQPDGGSMSNVDMRTTGAHQQHDGSGLKVLSCQKRNLLFFPVWIKFHGVPFSAFTAYRLNVIATRLGTPAMLDSCTATTCMKSWGSMDYTRALVDIRVDRALKDTMVNSVLNPVIKVEYGWKPPRYGTCFVFGHDDAQCPKRVIADLRNI
ncbi:hypothetical protein Tco_1563065, partial [Tanacetum coccineum]